MRRTTITRVLSAAFTTGCIAAYLTTAAGAIFIVDPSKVSPALSYSYTTSATTTAAATTAPRGGNGGGGAAVYIEPDSTTSHAATTTPESTPTPNGGNNGDNSTPVGTSPNGNIVGGEDTTYGGIVGEPDPTKVADGAGESIPPVPSATAVNGDEAGEQLPPHTGVGSAIAVPLALATAVALIMRGRKRD
ncbi:hypothetical protein FACS1894133_2360 [Clostridia bacterium]|nr:hypothetical protein FACS1894133_2360 [Clostridia bacterium]